MRFINLSRSLRLSAVALFSILLFACGKGEGPEEIIDPLFAGAPPPVSAARAVNSSVPRTSSSASAHVSRSRSSADRNTATSSRSIVPGCGAGSSTRPPATTTRPPPT